ncbi:sulfatase-like hydrolase/transferase [Rubellicoccus peritrichatus]|uniref:Sulfatase-like hydrolase/transferase n=1 Tax=Rubellicoccus peritrichatus TaxID=3080537 RepID=A0AAQ3LAL6_9BACT|nr:sulfatase-like hydrolase/transferase [Puniceicoccus sp. CR14]WOO41742.1 sulfatase-like hydrolase/transferase [Puniceicoccus sp. CR14]
MAIFLRHFQYPLCLLIFLFSHLAKADKQPNILWIITDDQRADSLACFNEATRGTAESRLGYVSSPNVDKLANEGVLFTAAYCNSPACAPSRDSMHTGRYPHRHGRYGFEQTHQEADFCTPTIPETMGANGYTAAHFGKSGYRLYKWGPGLTWQSLDHYNPHVDMKNDLRKNGLTDFYRNAIWENGKQTGTEEIWYFPNDTIKRYHVFRSDGELRSKDLETRAEIDEELEILRSYTRESPDLVLGGKSPLPTKDTLDGQILEAFESYLRHPNESYKTPWGKQLEGPDTDKPLFTHLSFCFPHTPVLPPEEFRKKFQDKVYKVPEFTKEELDSLPPQLVSLQNKMDFSNMKPEEKQQAIRDYYAFCAFGDYLIGQAVQSFKQYSEKFGRDYLIIFVCGDHGWHLGEQGIEAKFAPWDTSNHGAAIVSSSDTERFPPDTVYDGFIEYVDFAPTIINMAGVDVSESQYDYLDGYPLGDVLNGDAIQRDYVLGEMNHVYGPRAYLRSKDFAFSMRVRPKNGRPGQGYAPGENITWGLTAPRDDVEMALYDLRVDPLERKNLANTNDYRDLADWFRVKLGNIVLGDGRIECDWTQENVYSVSEFALGADDKALDIPKEIIPPAT